jgi:hypothetical protein
MSTEQRELLLPTLRFESATARSITSIARLRKDLAQIAQLGYALDDEEAVSGARCIGAAILDANGKVAGGISISGPTARINKTNLVSLAKTVKLAALEIFARLGLPKKVDAVTSGYSRRAAAFFAIDHDWLLHGNPLEYDFWYGQFSSACLFGGSIIPLLPLIYRKSAVWGYSRPRLVLF